MTIKLTDVDISNTELLLGNILIHTNADQRVQFTCEPGTGDKVIQRCRVKLSRVRESLKARGKSPRHFKLHHVVYPYTEAGKRFDCVVVWRSRNNGHRIAESIEALVGHGDTI